MIIDQELGPLPASNYMSGRSGHSMQWASASDPSYVVIHTMVGTLASANSIFHKDGHQTSAHYGVTANEIARWVSEDDTAFHSGSWDMNLNSIGIEHEDNGDYNGVRPDALYTRSAALVKWICQRYNIPITRQYIIRHNEVPGSSTSCPDSLDIDRIVREAGGNPIVAPAVPEIQIAAGVPGVVYDTATNDRSFLDYNSVQFVPGQIAAIGSQVRWFKAKQVNGKWLLGLAGAWALYDDCVDDTDATHDANHSSPPDFIAPPVVVPPVVVKPPVVVVPPVIPPVVKPPIVPIVTPPVVVPPVVTPPSEAVTFWEALFAWLKKYFGGK